MIKTSKQKMTQNSFEILDKGFLWALLVIPLIVGYLFWRGNRAIPYLNLPSTGAFLARRDGKVLLRPILWVLRLSALALLIVAMARPRDVEVSSRTFSNQGIDIVMAVDISGSMLARDLRPNRLEALKKVASEFIEGRKGDRIALVAYAGESYTATPLTTDHLLVTNTLNSLDMGVLEDGTAIGMGLGTAVNRLKDSDAKSKVIILLTDGVNNTGFIDPKTSAEIAREMGYKVYTIGLGTNGIAEVPYAIDPRTGKYLYTQAQVEIDEALLKEIAQMTGGKYFRATDNEKLRSIYQEIDKLEKSKVEDVKYYNYDEKYRLLILWAICLLGLELVLRNTIYRSFI